MADLKKTGDEIVEAIGALTTKVVEGAEGGKSGDHVNALAEATQHLATTYASLENQRRIGGH